MASAVMTSLPQFNGLKANSPPVSPVKSLVSSQFLCIFINMNLSGFYILVLLVFFFCSFPIFFACHILARLACYKIWIVQYLNCWSGTTYVMICSFLQRKTLE